LRALAKVWLCLGEKEKSASRLGEAACLLRGNGSYPLLADILLRLGQLSDSAGERGDAEKLYSEVVPIFRRGEDRKGLADALNNLGVVAGRQERLVEAEEAFLDAFDAYDAIGDENGRACVLGNLGVVRGSQARHEDSTMLIGESLMYSRETGNRHVIAASLNNLGVIDSLIGNGPDALKYFEASLESTDNLEPQEEQDRELFVAALENLSKIRLAANEPLDDLFEYMSHRAVDVDALEGWRLMKRGQELASEGLWNEAWMIMGRGECALGYGGELAPMRFVWCSVGLNDWVSSEGLRAPGKESLKG
jgi:tetratricopeptide (TPR) repeat protein